MDVQVIITVAGYLLTIGVVYGIMTTKTNNMQKTVDEIKDTLKNFGERLGTTEINVQSHKAVCEERHK